MEHLLELLKIVDGALNVDKEKVVSYTIQLANKLEKNGDKGAAKKLKSILSKSKTLKLNAAHFQGGNKIPVDSESNLAIGDKEYFEEGETQVFLDKNSEKISSDFLDYIKASSNFISKGINFNPSLLLYGPPGCGKSELAKQISAKIKLPIITARIDSLISSFLGNTSKNIRTLFDYANSNPCVLFLDEFDAIAKLRDDVHELGELKRVVVSLLQNIDKLDSHTILIAATNHSHLLDPAVWRRFSYTINVEKPKQEIRKEMFSHFLGEFGDPMSFDKFSKITEGFSGSEIKNLCEDSKRFSVVKNQDKANVSSLLSKIGEIILANQDQKDISQEEKIMTLRKLNSKVFTYAVLSEMFGVSLGYLSNLSNKDLKNGDSRKE